MSSEGFPRRTLQLTQSKLFTQPLYHMDHTDRAHLSYEKAKAIGLSYSTRIPDFGCFPRLLRSPLRILH